MIKSYQDYQYYLEADRIANGRSRIRFLSAQWFYLLFHKEYKMKYLRVLRKLEYYENCKRGILSKILSFYLHSRLHRLKLKTGFQIKPNCFGPGLSISHYGFVIVNGATKIGNNCRIHAGANIGTSAGYSDKAPVIGNNVYIGPGVKIFGTITIADNIAISANSVVNKDFMEPGITLGGMPARKIGDNGSRGILIRASDIIYLNLEREIKGKDTVDIERILSEREANERD